MSTKNSINCAKKEGSKNVARVDFDGHRPRTRGAASSALLEVELPASPSPYVAAPPWRGAGCSPARRTRGSSATRAESQAFRRSFWQRLTAAETKK